MLRLLGVICTDRAFVGQWVEDIQRRSITLLAAPDKIDPRRQMFTDIRALQSLEKRTRPDDQTLE